MRPIRGHLLVVDDDPDWTASITEFLEEEGFVVTTATDGLGAMQKLSEFEPLAIVTDLDMPAMDGRQLLAKARATYVHLPVIVVSGERVQKDDAALARALRIIRKPMPIEDLLTAIADAAAYRATHLPLDRLWRAAGVVAEREQIPAPRPRWQFLRRLCDSILASAYTRPVALTVAIASSFALILHLKTRLG